MTFWGTLGALAHSLGLVTVLGTLTAGAALTAAGFFAGSMPGVKVGQ